VDLLLRRDVFSIEDYCHNSGRFPQSKPALNRTPSPFPCFITASSHVVCFATPFPPSAEAEQRVYESSSIYEQILCPRFQAVDARGMPGATELSTKRMGNARKSKRKEASHVYGDGCCLLSLICITNILPRCLDDADTFISAAIHPPVTSTTTDPLSSTAGVPAVLESVNYVTKQGTQVCKAAPEEIDSFLPRSHGRLSCRS
jgi:hypothetical protein